MRIAAAVAMVREGQTIRRAAQAARVPKSTLHTYLHRSPEDGHVQEQETRVGALLDASYDIAGLAAESIRDSMIDNPDDWKPADLVRAYAASADRTIALTRPAQSTSPGVSALAQLLEAGDLTLTKRDTSRDAIDVTPEPSE
jgi:hypothetical protein